MTHPNLYWKRKIVAFLSVVWIFCWLAISACSSGKPEPFASPEAPTPIPSLSARETETPTLTPAIKSDQVILLASAGSDPLDLLAFQTLLGELAAQNSLSFETLSEASSIDFLSGRHWVVILPPDPGVQNLAASNPQAQFLAVGIPGVEAALNLSIIGSEGERSDQQGFLAGYLAAVITQDWRVGVVSRGDTVEGKAARLGFTNGVIFYCGLCRPAYPPYIQYPQYVELPDEASQAEQQAAADSLIQNAVKTVYVFPGSGDEVLLDLLTQAGIRLIGNEAPIERLQPEWVASIRVDKESALRLIWPRWIDGQGGIKLSAPLALADQNTALFSPGRQRLVERMLNDLLAGYIDTGVNLQTGEPR